MMKKSKVAAMAILVCIMLVGSPAMLLVQGQTPTTPAEKLVWLAETAGQQIQNLIDLIKVDDDALKQIEDVGLAEDFEAEVTLYETAGLGNLEAAQEALSDSEYENAVDYAVEALSVFREVYSSIHVIMEAADLQRDDLIENQGLLEAITRELQRIDHLRDILPVDTPQDILDILDTAAEFLSEARALLLAGEATAAKSAFLDAKESISQVYDYLKEQAEDYNTWRIYNYCERVRERIRERFRYGRDQGVDFTGVLQSLGYQSETQFMEALQSLTQTIQGEQNFGNVMQDCEGLSQMVQEMEQALNQEIYRHQGQYGSGGGYGGSGSGGSGNGYGGNGIG
jgi:tetratricopeptide (TPR) repeat protein